MDLYKLWNGEQYVFTLRKICGVIGIPVPNEFESQADEIIEEVGYNSISKKALNGEIKSICFDVWPTKDLYLKFSDYIKGGGVCCI